MQLVARERLTKDRSLVTFEHRQQENHIMRFKLKVVAHPGEDLESFEAVFEAPTWAAAGGIADVLVRQIGIKGSSTVTYADPTDAEIAAKEARRLARRTVAEMQADRA
ncbi:hypothetical protein EVC24_159 [Rhizobium phage RHph_I4]|nr:hypothetical protein EVC24_159 [Rhizobium phage RHph_I4]